VNLLLTSASAQLMASSVPFVTAAFALDREGRSLCVTVVRSTRALEFKFTMAGSEAKLAFAIDVIDRNAAPSEHAK
jgi:hypothetical protein